MFDFRREKTTGQFARLAVVNHTFAAPAFTFARFVGAGTSCPVTDKSAFHKQSHPFISKALSESFRNHGEQIKSLVGSLR